MLAPQKIIRPILLISFSLILSLGVGYALAQWTGPSTGPTGCAVGDDRCNPPLNISSANQTKTGGLTVGGPAGGFLVNANAIITGNLGIGSIFNSTNPPGAPLDVDGGHIIIRGTYDHSDPLAGGLVTTYTAGPNKVLTALDTTGTAVWASPQSVVGMPLGSFGQIIRNDGTSTNNGWKTTHAIFSANVVGTDRVGIGPATGAGRFCSNSVGTQCALGDLAPGGPDFNARLDVNGQVKIRGGGPLIGEVLTATTTDGLASWEPLPTDSSLWTTSFSNQANTTLPIKRNSEVHIGDFDSPSTPPPNGAMLNINPQGDDAKGLRTYGVYVIGGATAGVYSSVSAANAHGLQGVAGGSGGAGVRGSSSAPGGTGVFGENNSSTGVNYGVYGSVGSPSAYGVYGINTSGGVGILAKSNSGTSLRIEHNLSTGETIRQVGTSNINILEGRLAVGGINPASNPETKISTNGNIQIDAADAGGWVRGIIFKNNPATGGTCTSLLNAGMLTLATTPTGKDILMLCAKDSFGTYGWRTIW